MGAPSMCGAHMCPHNMTAADGMVVSAPSHPVIDSPHTLALPSGITRHARVLPSLGVVVVDNGGRRVWWAW